MEMNSSSESEVLKPHADYAQWQFFVAFDTFLLVASVYVLCAFAVFVWKSTLRVRGRRISTMTRTRQLKLLLYGLMLAYASLGTVKFALAQVLYYSPKPAVISRCTAVGMAYQLIHVIGTTSLYSFLWLRQNTLYREPGLASLATPALVRFSKLLLFVILTTGVAGVAGVLASSSPKDFAVLNGTNACYYVVKTGSNAIVVYIGYSVVLLVQGSNLFLFLHILRLHQKELKLNNASLQSATIKKIRRLVRYCSAAAAVSAFTDLTLILIDPHIKGRIIQLVTNSLWDIDYAINLCCTLFCFTNWRKIIAPWFPEKEKKQQDSAPAGGITTT